MAKFDKIAVLGKMGATGMVPVFYHKDAEVAKKVVKAAMTVESGPLSLPIAVTLPTRCLPKWLSMPPRSAPTSPLV